MAAVRARGNKSTEVKLRLALVRARIVKWRLSPSDVEGRPDFFFDKRRLAVFVDGCFWHGCPKCGHYPEQNRSFWRAKIDSNRRRDRRTTRSLRRHGVRVLRFWEHQLDEDLDRCVSQIRKMLQ